MIFLFWVLACLPASILPISIPTASANFEIPGFELVVTTPVETDLKNDDLRSPTEVWTEMIDGAKKSLDFEEMYLSGKDGEPLDQILTHLEAAAARGVKIRMIAEENMKRASSPETIERLKKIKSLELRSLKFGDMSPGGIIHAKFFILDGGASAYVGSQNFDWRSLKHIHEAGLRVTNAVIGKQMQSIFDHDWNAWRILSKKGKVPVLNSKPVLATGRGASAYLVASPNAFNPKGVPDSETELPRLLAEAKDEIRVQLLDYAPLSRDHTYYAVIDNALRAAHARGVKVKLMVSHWNTEKPGIDYLKSLSVLPGVEVKIVTIPQLKERIPFARVNHSKIMSIDNKIAWVGTSNWSGGYMDKTRNIEIVLRDEKFAQRLTALHDQLWNSPYAEKIDLNKDYPKPNKGVE